MSNVLWIFFELMRGEWKNQISVIGVVILGLGVV